MFGWHMLYTVDGSIWFLLAAARHYMCMLQGPQDSASWGAEGPPGVCYEAVYKLASLHVVQHSNDEL